MLTAACVAAAAPFGVVKGGQPPHPPVASTACFRAGVGVGQPLQTCLAVPPIRVRARDGMVRLPQYRREADGNGRKLMTDDRGVLRPGREGPERPTLLELLLDLVYVFALTRFSQRLVEDFTTDRHIFLPEAGQTALLLLALWHVWVQAAWVTSKYDPRQPVVQLPNACCTRSVAVTGISASGPPGDTRTPLSRSPLRLCTVSIRGSADQGQQLLLLLGDRGPGEAITVAPQRLFPARRSASADELVDLELVVGFGVFERFDQIPEVVDERPDLVRRLASLTWVLTVRPLPRPCSSPAHWLPWPFRSTPGWPFRSWRTSWPTHFKSGGSARRGFATLRCLTLCTRKGTRFTCRRLSPVETAVGSLGSVSAFVTYRCPTLTAGPPDELDQADRLRSSSSMPAGG